MNEFIVPSRILDFQLFDRLIGLQMRFNLEEDQVMVGNL